MGSSRPRVAEHGRVADSRQRGFRRTAAWCSVRATGRRWTRQMCGGLHRALLRTAPRTRSGELSASCGTPTSPSRGGAESAGGDRPSRRPRKHQGIGTVHRKESQCLTECLSGKKEAPQPGGEELRPAVMLVGDTGFEPVTSSVSRKRATTAPIARDDPKSHMCGLRAIEVETGFEPV